MYYVWDCRNDTEDTKTGRGVCRGREENVRNPWFNPPEYTEELKNAADKFLDNTLSETELALLGLLIMHLED